MKWGILATGTIAQKFASTVEQMGAEGEQLVAVGSRHMESAQAFAQQYSIPHCYDSYEALAADPEVIRCLVDINDFEYEIREASRCVKLGRTGSDRYTPQDSLALTRLMYDTRMSWGMKFAGEA